MVDMSNFTLATQGERTAPIRVTWAGNPWSLTGLCFLNILLSVITLGIYWCWARSEYRRRMWQMVRVEGEPLEYTGTGLELFIGYLKLFLFVFLPAIAAVMAGQLLFGPQSPLTIAIMAVLYIGFFFFIFAGVFRANRYILSRTRWRGIAFGLDQGAGGYAWTAVWSAVLSAFTLGWILPWRVTALRRRITNAMHFGSARFRFEGGSGPLYGPFAFTWVSIALIYAGLLASMPVFVPELRRQLLAPHRRTAVRAAVELDPNMLFVGQFVALAIPVALILVIIGLNWYAARKLNTFAEATKADGVSAHLETTGGSTFWLGFTNTLILVFSLGILRPVAQARRLRYLVERLSFSGSVDLNKVLRGPEEERPQGAGVEAAFSIEIF